MRDDALALVATTEDPARRLNLLREYVQAYVLRSLHEQEAFTKIAFVGGTALRFLENLPRFSEDLDFSLLDGDGYQPELWLKKVRRDLELAGFDCGVTFNPTKTVQVCWIRIADLLQQAGLSARPEQKLSIKLEIDTRPPAGAQVQTAVIVRHLTFAVRHYGMSSLMAGKVHAILCRSYPKGRDWFDLVWYCGHRPPVEPEVTLLQNALDQTEGLGRFDARKWRDHVRHRLGQLDTDALVRDVSPFLERSADRHLLSRETFEAALSAT
jgi:hypothetical protein